MYYLSINNDFSWETSLIQIQIFEADNINGRVRRVILQFQDSDRIEPKTILMDGQKIENRSITTSSNNLSIVCRVALERLFQFKFKNLVRL